MYSTASMPGAAPVVLLDITVLPVLSDHDFAPSKVSAIEGIHSSDCLQQTQRSWTTSLNAVGRTIAAMNKPHAGQAREN